MFILQIKASFFTTGIPYTKTTKSFLAAQIVREFYLKNKNYFICAYTASVSVFALQHPPSKTKPLPFMKKRAVLAGKYAAALTRMRSRKRKPMCRRRWSARLC
jgi:hypothetical protein